MRWKRKAERRNNQSHQLFGVCFSTARARLFKMVLFDLVVSCNRDVCFRCGAKILSAEELSLEHKEQWRTSLDPVSSFYSLGNISFSHLECNQTAAGLLTKKFASRKEADRARNKRNQATHIVSKRRWRKERREAGLPYS